MALAQHDPMPSGISIRDAYSAVRDSYQMHAADDASPHAQSSLSLVRVLPRPEQVTEVEARAILAEVIMGTVNEVEFPIGHSCLQ